MSQPPDIADHRQRILIVDDEFHNRQLLEVMLAREGCLVLTAASGEEALAVVAQRPPDLIIIDVMMPGLDGFQVTRALKGAVATKNIPVIILTARDDRDARMMGLNSGAEDFITQPVDHGELCARVRNLLRLKAYCDYHDRYSQLLEGEVGSRTAELVASERLYRSTFDAAPVGIAHVGLDGRWLRVNQRLRDLLGYAHGELPGVASQGLHQSPGEVESWRQMAAGTRDRCVTDEKQLRRLDGGLVWARVNASVHRDEQGRALHFIAVIEDITERRELEAQVRQASRMDAIGQLASGVAHDFNNILSVVISYSEMLAADMEEGDPMRADLGEIQRAGLRAADLTRQLLAFSRKQVLQLRSVDLNEVLLGMETMLRRLIGENVELTATRSPALRKILVDPGQMEQVIMNLAVNARDAMPRGGRLTLETAEQYLDEAFAREHAGVKPGPHVVLTVSDSGTGMDGPTLAQMFEPFFTTKEVGKGTGLGLATVFGIVRQSGGTITVRSELGEGTTFKVYLPTQDQDSGARASSISPDHPTLCGTETILLVEDEERVRDLVRTILCRYGYNVLDAQGGGDALLLCEQHHRAIDLLLTDVVMPRMSGRQLAERLVAIHPALRVLYMSGYTDDVVVRHGALDSTIRFLQKPITPESLGRAVREALDAVGRA